MAGWQAELAEKAWKHVNLTEGVFPSKERSTLPSSINLSMKSLPFLFVISYLHLTKQEQCRHKRSHLGYKMRKKLLILQPPLAVQQVLKNCHLVQQMLNCTQVKKIHQKLELKSCICSDIWYNQSYLKVPWLIFTQNWTRQTAAAILTSYRK